MDDAAPPARDWSSLPFDALSSIFALTGAVDVLMGAGLVCRSWREAAKLPDVWRVIDMDKHEVLSLKDDDVLQAMAKAAVRRSDGQLRMFAGKQFVTDELIKSILESSPLLRTLRLVSCYDVSSKQVASSMKESPLLELRSLELENTDITVEDLTAVLEGCPALEVLSVCDCFEIDDDEEGALRAKFARIKTMTLEWYDVYSCDYSSWSYEYSNNESTPESEDEMTDCASVI